MGLSGPSAALGPSACRHPSGRQVSRRRHLAEGGTMTPPKIDKVDIKALDSLYLENLLGLSPDEAAKRLKGTGRFTF